MATKKAAVKKSSTTAKKAPSKPTTTTKVKTGSTVAASVSTGTKAKKAKIDNSVINIVLAELVGTFALTLVALLALKDVLPLYVGLTVAVLVMAIGAISGTHINPAVTFGLWTAKKIKAILIPFYWGAQFLGAMAAIVVLNAVAGTTKGLDFGHFMEFSWAIFFIELIGTAVFMFGLMSVINRAELSTGGKAIGIGLSLFVGLLVATSILEPARTQAITNYGKDAADAKEAPAIPHQIFVSGATLNPAVALAATETTESTLRGTQADESEKRYSRLSLEVIVSTLAGAAIGANLARLLGYRFKA